MNLMLFLVKFIKFKQRIKFKKFELHNYAKLWLALPHKFIRSLDTLWSIDSQKN